LAEHFAQQKIDYSPVRSIQASSSKKKYGSYPVAKWDLKLPKGITTRPQCFAATPTAVVNGGTYGPAGSQETGASGNTDGKII
jgi:hypothetical protein